MAGSEFIRADLHVHSFPDAGQGQAIEIPIADIQTAQDRGLGVLEIMDHNTIRNVKAAVDAATGSELLVLPGMRSARTKVTSWGCSPQLRSTNSKLSPCHRTRSLPQSKALMRNGRPVRCLTSSARSRAEGGLAIPAHIDAEDGICRRMASTAMTDLLKHPGLAALEFLDREALKTWFADGDEDDVRRNAWHERQRVDELRNRGLARIMCSDAHSLEKLGEDRSRRTLTRLRLDEANFDAVRNAIVLSPKARCKAEAILPFSYPRILKARFEGGFLDGVEMDISANLTCIIGGRGSGKSTALLAVRAAVGAPIPDDEDPDDPERMPDLTEVKFIDSCVHPKVVSERLGHASITITLDTYSHAIPAMQETAASLVASLVFDLDD
jgi:hypothetical protein